MPGFCEHCGGTVGTPGKVHQLCKAAVEDAADLSDPGGLQVPITPPTHDALVAYAAERGHLVPTWPEKTTPMQFQLSPDDIKDLRPIFPKGLQSAPGRVFRNEECVLNEAIVCLSVYEDGHRSRERVRVVLWAINVGYAEMEIPTSQAEGTVGEYPHKGWDAIPRTLTLGGTPELDTDQETMRQAMAKADAEAREPMIPTPLDLGGYTADVDTDTSGCLFAGPGRGDCEHAVGLPGEDRDVDHDGPRTEDAYGRPNGWCWSCWKSYRIATLEREAMAKDHHATLDTSPIDVVD